MKDCVNCFPDWNNGRGSKVRPFFGRVIILDEGALISWKWWKNMKKYEFDPNTPGL